MPTPEILNTLLNKLLGAAQQRPDLLGEATGGPSFGSPGYRPTGEQSAATYLGRVVQPGDTLPDVLSRFPQAEAESGGLAMQAPELMKAAIPLSLWKAMTPEAKAIVTNYANKYPLKFERALSDPQDLFLMRNVDPNVHGFYENYGKQGGHIAVDENAVARGTTTHEMQHYLDRNRVRNTKPTDAATIGLLLEEQLIKNLPQGKDPNKELGSLLTAVDRLYSRDPFPMAAGKPSDLLNWILSGKPSQRPKNAQPGIEAPTPYLGDVDSVRSTMPINDILRRMTMDEGLAYLAQHSAKPDAPSMLKLLAARLGVLPE